MKKLHLDEIINKLLEEKIAYLLKNERVSPLINLTLRAKNDDSTKEVTFSASEILNGENLRGLILLMMIEAGKRCVFDEANDVNRTESYYEYKKTGDVFLDSKGLVMPPLQLTKVEVEY
jgi:hypothetical protein